MKRLLFLFSLLIFRHLIGQTYVLIPDPNFVTCLNSIVPAAMSGNSLNITSSLVTTVTQTINVSYKNISDLNGIQYFSSLKYLDCNINSLTSFPPLPNTLNYLDCEHNYITSLSNLPNSVETINCGYNQLSIVQALPSSLKFFYCYYNPITSLPLLPNSLKVLDCDGTSLANLPSLPDSLQSLFCYGNSLSSLPILPNSLKNLVCGNNSLTTLPALPSSLKTLYCSQNLLTSLPTLPNSLQEINCGLNLLSTLPALPNSLRKLFCNYMVTFSILPQLPHSLRDLACNNCSIINLPSLSDSLSALDCSNNSLVNLPSLPDSLHILYCNNNNISCLPKFPTSLLPAFHYSTQSTYYLNLSNNPFTCLPNYLPLVMPPYLLAYPICTPVPLYTASTTILELCQNESSPLKYINADSLFCNKYQWTKNGINIPNATSNLLIVNDTGVYTINLDCFGCAKNIKLGVFNVSCKSQFIAFPNPSNQILIIQVDSIDNTFVSIHNELGQVVYSNKILTNTTKLDISSLATGLYYISINNGTTITRQKIIKSDH